MFFIFDLDLISIKCFFFVVQIEEEFGVEKISSMFFVIMYVIVLSLFKVVLIEWQVMVRNDFCDINGELCLYVYQYWMNYQYVYQYMK